MRYGERLKAAREYAKLNQTQLAEDCGVTQPTISELETTPAIGSSFTARFARRCNVSVDWLADEIGDMIPADHLNDAARQILDRLSTLTEREQYKVARMVNAFSNDTDSDPPAPANHDIRKRKMEG